MRIVRAIGVANLLLAGCATFSAGVSTEQLESISLPEGFEISLYSDRVPGARSIARGDEGTIFVSTRGEGRIYALTDRNGDYTADVVNVIYRGGRMPNGIAFRDGDLYIADIGRILVLRNVESNLDNPPEPEVLYEGLPTDRAHGWKYIDFGPDGMLYVPVGAPCNICNPSDPIYAAIHKMNPDGSSRTLVAEGVRNTVGFDWHPRTNELWFTDNGRDWMGDNRPPDELNRVAEEGAHYGYPFLHGNGIEDPEFHGQMPSGLNPVPPVQALGPHVAALGMHFYEGRMFPEEYRGQLFIAEHGSWNRSTPIGYRVTLVRLDGNEATGYEVFAEGWLEANGESWGRPVDVFELPDGSLLLSDDKAGAVYRITYEEPVE